MTGLRPFIARAYFATPVIAIEAGGNLHAQSLGRSERHTFQVE